MQWLLSDLSTSSEQAAALFEWSSPFCSQGPEPNEVPHADVSPVWALVLNEQMNECVRALDLHLLL